MLMSWQKQDHMPDEGLMAEAKAEIMQQEIEQV